MHLDFQKANVWTKIFIGAAIEVHRLKGPGLLEPIYQSAFAGNVSCAIFPLNLSCLFPSNIKALSLKNRFVSIS